MRLIDADELINTIDCLILHTVRVAFDKFGSSFAEGVKDGYCRIRSEVLAMPTAESKWIPCSERLPDKDGDYLITYDESYANDNDYDRLVSIAPFEVASEAFGYWHQCLGTNGWLGEDWINIPVVAWMPLPSPWKGADDDRQV